MLTGCHTMVDGETVPGEWSWEGQFIEIVDVESPATYYDFGLASPSMSSWVIVPGLPEEGRIELPFTEPPIVTSFERNDELRPGDVLEWMLSEVDAADSELRPDILITDYSGNVLINVALPPGTTSARVPLPPSDVSLAEILGSGGFGYVRTCDSNEAETWCLRGSTSVVFEVEP